MPSVDAVKLAEVAVAVSFEPALRRTALPTAVPPVAHPDALFRGPQTEKLTLPPGTPPRILPVTVATSVFVSPSTMVVPLPGLEEVVEEVRATAKHSSAPDPSLAAL
jgi:hypothetical protein